MFVRVVLRKKFIKYQIERIDRHALWCTWRLRVHELEVRPEAYSFPNRVEHPGAAIITTRASDQIKCCNHNAKGIIELRLHSLHFEKRKPFLSFLVEKCVGYNRCCALQVLARRLE